jgi:hypothetical protein
MSFRGETCSSKGTKPKIAERVLVPVLPAASLPVVVDVFSFTVSSHPLAVVQSSALSLVQSGQWLSPAYYYPRWVRRGWW